jgi:hypothetical protein
MPKTSLAKIQPSEDEKAPVQEKPRPFALRFAERVKRKPSSKVERFPVFDDPTTVEHTAPDDEDAHTDEA